MQGQGNPVPCRFKTLRLPQVEMAGRAHRVPRRSPDGDPPARLQLDPVFGRDALNASIGPVEVPTDGAELSHALGFDGSPTVASQELAAKRTSWPVVPF